MKITEIKKHLDGRREEFVCDALVLESDFALLDFVWKRDEPLVDGPIELPAGDICTHAYFWEGRNYLVYKIFATDGRLFGHRFDVCTDMVIHDDQTKLEWVDLILDLWVDSEDEIHVLDEEEVIEFDERGLLTDTQKSIIDQTKTYLLQNYLEIITALGE